MSDREERRRHKEVIELITFPSSKNFPPEDQGGASSRRPLPIIDDPLEDLLNEFGPYEEYFNEEIETFSQEDILCWLGVDPDQLAWLKEHDQPALLAQQIDLLTEIGHRLKYYLDEIEQVLPLKR